jgi:hypothetical protein
MTGHTGGRVTGLGGHREDTPVRKPDGDFRSRLRKAGSGELRLHKFVFGILKRGRGQRDV